MPRRVEPSLVVIVTRTRLCPLPPHPLLVKLLIWRLVVSADVETKLLARGVSKKSLSSNI
jgi:hypothetical protein